MDPWIWVGALYIAYTVEAIPVSAADHRPVPGCVAVALSQLMPGDDRRYCAAERLYGLAQPRYSLRGPCFKLILQ